MRRILDRLTVAVQIALGVPLILLLGALVNAMRRDRRERNRNEDRWVFAPYDDNDPGEDIDISADDVANEHALWHEHHGTVCDESLACDEFARAVHLCEQCLVEPIECYANMSTNFCSTQCADMWRHDMPRGPVQ